MSKTWKEVENRIAKVFGSTRTPLSGSNSKHTMSDTLHPELYIEIKHGKSSVIETLFKEWKKDRLLFITDGDKKKIILVHIDNLTKQPIKEVKEIQRKNFAIFGLFMDTMTKATQEKKMPLVCLHKKGSHGFFVICKVKDHSKIKRYLDVRNKEMAGGTQ